jgi:multiple sugar transport system permease protein
MMRRLVAILKSLLYLFNHEKFFKNLLVLPMQLLLNFLLLPPFAIVIYLAFVNWQPIFGSWTEAPFVGVNNFIRLFAEPHFYEALGRTFVIVIVAVAIEFMLGLALAVLFSRPFWGRRICTSVILYPMMLPWVVVGFTFYLLFLDHGPVNYVLSSLFGPSGMISWFRSPISAIVAIIIGDIWQWTPFMFLIFYSALGALPKDPKEAAMTLGASSWQIFRYITFPMIKPVVYVGLVIRALECFKIFDLVYIMTGGGPGVSTETLSLYIYRVAFKYGQLSYAAAVAIIVLLSIALVIRLAVRPLLKEVV